MLTYDTAVSSLECLVMELRRRSEISFGFQELNVIIKSLMS